MRPEELQKLFKTLADPTRVRILRLLEREELAVHELTDVLGMTQSRVSRHLGILREAGLVRDRRDGTLALYRLTPPENGAWGTTWGLVQGALADDPDAARDAAALDRVLAARSARSLSFFDAVGPEWDALRKVWSDDLLRARAVGRLVPPGLRVLDVGTGTGVLALELAGLGLQVIAVDRSERMLEALRSKLEAARRAGAPLGVELRQGDAASLPLADGEVDAAFAHMVLQYLEAPADALRELARAIRPGGTLVVVDFARHEREWMREELGALRLGIDPDEVQESLRAAGFEDLRVERVPTQARGSDLPETFILSARRGRRPTSGAERPEEVA